jgi:hypothetical protein
VIPREQADGAQRQTCLETPLLSDSYLEYGFWLEFNLTSCSK